MSQQTTIRKLAELVNTPVDKLLEQLAEAGMNFDGPDQVVTSMEKVKLLGFLKRAHGKSAKAAEEVAAPRKITLSRSRKQELTVGGGKNRSTVDVVVRTKVTLVKPSEAEAAAPTGSPEEAEHVHLTCGRCGKDDPLSLSEAHALQDLIRRKRIDGRLRYEKVINAQEGRALVQAADALAESILALTPQGKLSELAALPEGVADILFRRGPGRSCGPG